MVPPSLASGLSLMTNRLFNERPSSGSERISQTIALRYILGLNENTRVVKLGMNLVYAYVNRVLNMFIERQDYVNREP